jgi:hypothetical protein
MMPDITIDIPEDKYDRLEETADAHDTTIERAILRAINHWNSKPHTDEELDDVIDDLGFSR